MRGTHRRNRKIDEDQRERNLMTCEGQKYETHLEQEREKRDLLMTRNVEEGKGKSERRESE